MGELNGAGVAKQPFLLFWIPQWFSIGFVVVGLKEASFIIVQCHHLLYLPIFLSRLFLYLYELFIKGHALIYITNT